MSVDKAFVLQRICVYAGKAIDPSSDKEVVDMLRSKFDIRLPQRRSMLDSLTSSASNHEIIQLLIDYRQLH